MDIKSSLAIEEAHPNTINFILSGSFARVYNRSFYLLTEVLGKSLKANIKRIKSADNRLVVSGGFPFHAIEKNYPQVRQCEWGYQIQGDFNSDGYWEWLLRHEAAADAVVNAVIATTTACPQERAQAVVGSYTEPVYKDSVELSLSSQQVNYLLNWQKGIYPIEVDLGFIESLRQQFINKNNRSD